MQSLISNKGSRILKILNYVLVKKETIFISDVMSLNNCSKKTAYNDLDEIRVKFDLNLYDYDYDDSENLMNVYQFIKIKNELLRNEPSIKLLIELYNRPNQDILNLSIAINKSESHTRSQLICFEKFLKDYNIILKKNSMGQYRLEGRDKFTLAMFFSEIFKITSYDVFMEGNVSYMRREHFKNLPYYKRELKMIELVYEEFENNENNEITLYEFFRPYRNKLSSYLISQSKEIYHFMNKNNLVITNEQKEKAIKVLSVIFAKEKMQPIRVNSLLNRYDYFYLDTNRQKKDLVILFDDFCDEILVDEFSIVSYKTELFFHLYNILDLYKRVDQKLIGVYSDMGYDHVSSLCNEIDMYFHFHTIEHYCEGKFYDLVITTCDIQNELNLEILYIDDFINPLDVQQIYSKLLTL